MTSRTLLLASLFAILLAQTAARASSLPREEDAVYLEDLLDKPLRLTVLEDTSIFYDKGLGRYLGTLRRGQTVELQAVADEAYRARGRAQQGQVAGWIDPARLTPLDKGFLKKLKEAATRQKHVNELIAANEVAIHMTPDEVISSLGKPQKKTSRLDQAGRSEVWEYIRYERVPRQVSGYDRNGALFTNVIYVKVPAGRLSVIFDAGLVSALEQTEGSLRNGRVKMVAAPFEIE